MIVGMPNNCVLVATKVLTNLPDEKIIKVFKKSKCYNEKIGSKFEKIKPCLKKLGLKLPSYMKVSWDDKTPVSFQSWLDCGGHDPYGRKMVFVNGKINGIVEHHAAAVKYGTVYNLDPQYFPWSQVTMIGYYNLENEKVVHDDTC
jgi:hypothetical protein